MKLEKLTPAFKDYLWGGTKLRDVYHKPCDFDKIAESWELSTHPAGQSKISGGEYDGLTLEEYFEKLGKAALGKNCQRFQDFPVLIKFIDAKDPLSIQVHPSDEYALRVEHQYGKTEMWYVMDCEPGAYLYFGVNREVTREEFAQRIANNTVLEVLNKVDVHPGDVFFIQSGTIHAIGAGILICEIQQNSNCTYRVYDYGRVGNDGKPRQLHVEKAKDVTALVPPTRPTKPQGDPVDCGGYVSTLLSSCEYFTVHALDVKTGAALSVDDKSFHSIMCLNGTFTFESAHGDLTIEKGDSVFLPAGYGAYTVKGTGELIVTTV